MPPSHATTATTTTTTTTKTTSATIPTTITTPNKTLSQDKTTKTTTTIHHDKNGNELCNIFLTKGKCRYGKKCHRSHNVPDALAAEYYERLRTKRIEEQQKMMTKHTKKKPKKSHDANNQHSISNVKETRKDKERPTCQKSNSRIAVHYIYQNLESYNNVYLTCLFKGDLYPPCGSILLKEMSRDESCKKLLNHNSLKKELTEGLGVLHLMQTLLCQSKRRNDDALMLCGECGTMMNECKTEIEKVSFARLIKSTNKKPLRIIDVCSGKGIFSVLSALLFNHNNKNHDNTTASTTKTTKIQMVDSNPNMNLSHLSYSKLQHTISFFNFDVYSKSFELWIRQQWEEAREDGELLVLVGLHLCGTLSTRLTFLFSSLLEENKKEEEEDSTAIVEQDASHNDRQQKEVEEEKENLDAKALLILSPCCMPKRDKTIVEYCRTNKTNIVDPYEYWCQHVYDELKDETQRGMIVDKHVLSSKNRFVWTMR